MREYVGLPSEARQVAFVPGHPPRLAAVTDAAAYVWPPDEPDPVKYSWGKTARGEPVLTVSPDGRWLVAGPNEHLRGWALAGGRPRPKDLAHAGRLAAQLSATGGRLNVVNRVYWRDEVIIEVDRIPLTGRGRDECRFLDLLPHLESRVRKLKPSACRRKVALSADGRRFALSPNPKAVCVWDVDSGQMLGDLALRQRPSGLSFSPDGSRLVVDVGTVYVYDTTTLDLVGRWKAKYSYSPGLAWSPDGRLLARTDNSTTVRIYEAATGRQVLALGARGGRLTCVAFSPDGLTLATGTHEGPVRVWDVD